MVEDVPEIIDTIYLVLDTVVCKEYEEQTFRTNVIENEGYVTKWKDYVNPTRRISIEEVVAEYLKTLGYLRKRFNDYEDLDAIMKAVCKFQKDELLPIGKLDYETCVELRCRVEEYQIKQKSKNR